MVLAAAGALALHDATSGVQAAGVALMAGRVALVLNNAVNGCVALPSLASDKEQLVLGIEAQQLAVLLEDVGDLLVAGEVSEVRHARLSSRW